MSAQPVIQRIATQHAEEAAFQWLLRDAAVAAPHYTLAELAQLDAKVDAHIDGLRIAGDAGWEIAAMELGWKEPGEVFAAGVLAFESGDAERIAAVLGVAAVDPELARGAISALGWLDLETVRPHIEALFGSDDPGQRRIGLRAAAVHRWRAQVALEVALESSEPGLVAAALRAIGELGAADLLGHCRRQLEAEDPTCRFWAAWSLALCGDGAGLAVLQAVALSEDALAGKALDVACRAMGAVEAQNWHRRLVHAGEAPRVAVELAGKLGDPALVPWLLEQMSTPDLARPAGEAFSLITAVDLAYEDLDTDRPEDFEAGPTEDPEDEDVSMDADEDLPWPDPGLLQQWWAENGSRFQPGTRYLRGWPITAESMNLALREGAQRQRASAALELVLLQPQPRQPLFEIRAPGLRQQRLLGLAG